MVYWLPLLQSPLLRLKAATRSVALFYLHFYSSGLFDTVAFFFVLIVYGHARLPWKLREQWTYINFDNTYSRQQNQYSFVFYHLGAGYDEQMSTTNIVNLEHFSVRFIVLPPNFVLLGDTSVQRLSDSSNHFCVFRLYISFDIDLVLRRNEAG